jgi:ATP-dependent DNA helicase RecG
VSFIVELAIYGYNSYMTVAKSLNQLTGIGPQLAVHLAKLDVNTPLDLLFHLPKTYQDRTQIYPLSELRPGLQVLVEGEVIQREIVRGRSQMLICHIADHTGYLLLRFFHFHTNQLAQLQPGKRIRCFGEIRAGRRNFEMIHPEYRLLQNENETLPHTLTPVYPSTEGLTQGRLRKAIQQALSLFTASSLPEYLPSAIASKLHLPTLYEAICFVHYPPADVDTSLLLKGSHPMQQRLAFEELLAHRLSLRQLRAEQHQRAAVQFLAKDALWQQLLNNLPFALTKAQQRVCAEIAEDLAKPAAMLRLLQGDVGAGKTLVAIFAALRAIESGYQAAVMAPTEILAEQHYLNFGRWLEPLGIKISYLSSKLSQKQKREALVNCQTGQAQLIVGTHALFQENVAFQRLALVIIDEQHRFGVEQRHALQQKGKTHDIEPHQLVMTATPIPRTLAMTAYADLDLSIIDELPPGRTPIKTVLISDQRREEVIERVQASCQVGKQAYWVCTLIEESEVLTCRAAEDTATQLQTELPHLNIGLVHGRMKPSEKSTVMSQFKAGEIHLLVATTVIEVGVDVPNASLMIIENPERLGLSQLHQLRGRVGRGSTESFCVLLYQSPLSQMAKSRLQIIRDSNDGFKIAEQDLELRGPGEVLGTRQTGDIGFRIASLIRDQALLSQVQRAADTILQQYPHCIQPLINRWIGKAQQYARV